MAKITIGTQTFEDIDMIICDKDGTLTNFNVMWGTWIKNWIDLLVKKTGEKHDLDRAVLTANLDKTLGFRRESTSVVPESPVAVSTLSKISTAAMVVLYQSGIDWHSAEELIGEVASQPVIMTEEMVEPVGQVKLAFESWVAGGIKIIIATSDDREPTLEAIKIMGVDHLVTEYYCGDDPVPNKPNPEAIHRLKDMYNIKPNHMLMVGDAVSDLAFGRNGKVAGCIAISGGSGDQMALKGAADLVVDSVDKILVAN